MTLSFSVGPGEVGQALLHDAATRHPLTHPTTTDDSLPTADAPHSTSRPNSPYTPPMAPADAGSAALDALIARCADKVRMVGRADRP